MAAPTDINPSPSPSPRPSPAKNDNWNREYKLPVGTSLPDGRTVPADGLTDSTDDLVNLAAYMANKEKETGTAPTLQYWGADGQAHTVVTESEMAVLDADADAKKPKFDFDVNVGMQGLGPHQAMLTRPLSELQSQGYLGADRGVTDLVQAAAKNKPADYEKVYQKAVVLAAIKQKSGDDVTVEDLLTKWAKSGVPGAGSTGGAFSTTTRSVTLTNESTARGLLNQTLARFLGRTSTAEEQAKFLKALNVEEKANPTRTNQSGFTSGGNTTQNINTSGGYSREDFADRFAKSQEGYAEYQTATTYLDAFIEALENPTRLI